MPDHRIFQELHHWLNETGSFHLTRHEDGQQRAVCSSIMQIFSCGNVLSLPAWKVNALKYFEIQIQTDKYTAYL